MLTTGLISKVFLFGLNKTELHGLDGFRDLLDERRDVQGRQRGLITVSNHVSVVDDPLIWGALPLQNMLSPDNLRWGLGSYDICFTNNALSTFFSTGQVLPTHRAAHSKFGGLFQPTITEAIRLLCRGPFTPYSEHSTPPSHAPAFNPVVTDPFSSGQLTYSTTGADTFPAPSVYPSRRYSWIHIFPEGKIHQREDKAMRYFKWGVARLILESEPCPAVVPIWIEGIDEVMHESRTFPRFIPRVFKNISITFGAPVDTDDIFGDLRQRWQRLRRREEDALQAGQSGGGGDGAGAGAGAGSFAVGVLTDRLKYGREAIELRMECAMRVRAEVLKLRKLRGLPDEDPKASLVETWREEGPAREGRMQDGSWVKDT
ncbi:MAG: hypothetical protein M1819_006655 [Sarea resinae]|nr:MAG: hypothetical protein M1819_006655 [Sarea resinae]